MIGAVIFKLNYFHCVEIHYINCVESFVPFEDNFVFIFFYFGGELSVILKKKGAVKEDLGMDTREKLGR